MARKKKAPPARSAHGLGNPFLCLPPELRNSIYEYALTEEDGAIYYRSCGNRFHEKAILYVKAGVNKKKIREANQLKSVCRQLRVETAGLEMRYNVIHFEKLRHLASTCTPASCAVEFLKSFKLKNLIWLGTLRIAAHRFYRDNFSHKGGPFFKFDCNDGVMVELRYFARNHPNITIEWA